MTTPQLAAKLLGNSGGGGTLGDPSVNQIVRKLKEEGAVCLQSFFDRRTVEKMRSEVVALLTARGRGRRYVHVRPKVLRRFPSSNQAFNSDFFKEIAVGYDPKCRFFFKRGVTIDYAKRPGKKLTDIHFDMTRSLKFMIYLSDVDKESGAFRYCLGSHRENRKLRNRFLFMGGRIKRLPNVPGSGEEVILTDMEGPRGTLIVFDTDGFHSAGTLQKGKERLLIRARILLSGWFDNKTLRRAAELNPLRFFLPLLAPEGRRATGGTARAKYKLKH